MAGATGELTDLAALLRNLRPVLDNTPYGFRTAPTGAVIPDDAFAIIRETEGMTIVAPGEGWARISLSVHSSLFAIGLSAAISAALVKWAIPCNIVAGFHHDHLFVPWERGADAMAAIATLSEAAR